MASAFTVGMDMTGKSYIGLDWSKWDTVLAIVVVSSYVCATVWLIIQIGRGWLNIAMSRVFYLICVTNILLLLWEIMLFVVHSRFVVPFTSWLLNVIGVLGMLVTILGNMDILKTFCVNSTVLTVERIGYGQIAYIIFNVITMAGLYMSIFILGTPIPQWMFNWYVYGYILFAVTSLCYETFHCYYVSNQIIQQSEMRNQLANVTGGSMETRAYSNLYYLVLVGAAIDWIAAIIWIAGWFATGNLNMTLAIIGGQIGMGHIIFLTIIFKLIKEINVRKLRSTGADGSHATQTATHTDKPKSEIVKRV
ncbi:hypothetical protein HDV06_002313 [Boothiomyces sp. JEL0866]|nr:hypothetical protein HDV06_002313 [Boothiomyces sp. JEL0866]